MSFQRRWSRTRVEWTAPNIITAAAVVAIVILVLTIGVKDGKINAGDLLYFLCFIPAVICHEVSHGLVAYWRGDDTAKRAGRLTANPIRHIDPVGSLILPIILVLSGLPAFGWARPVPVNVSNLRSPRNDAVLVGLVGPFTNILLAAIAGVVLHLCLQVPSLAESISTWSLPNIAVTFGVVNIILAVFNLIPIPPLDGSSILERAIPSRYLPQYYQMRFAMIIVVVLLVLFDQSLLGNLFDHVANWYINLFV